MNNLRKPIILIAIVITSLLITICLSWSQNLKLSKSLKDLRDEKDSKLSELNKLYEYGNNELLVANKIIRDFGDDSIYTQTSSLTTFKCYHSEIPADKHFHEEAVPSNLPKTEYISIIEKDLKGENRELREVCINEDETGYLVNEHQERNDMYSFSDTSNFTKENIYTSPDLGFKLLKWYKNGDIIYRVSENLYGWKRYVYAKSPNEEAKLVEFCHIPIDNGPTASFSCKSLNTVSKSSKYMGFEELEEVIGSITY